MQNNSAFPVQTLKAHLAINVRNVEQSIEFYRKMFGIEPSKVRNGYAKFDVQNPPLNFTLNQVPFNEKGVLSHLGIQVGTSEDVLAVREQWQKAGLTTRDEIKTDCCYAVQDKTWVSDPDGNSWEVFVVLEDNLPEVVNAANCCAPVSTSESKTESATCSTTTTSATASCCVTNTEPIKLIGLSKTERNDA
ncbi:MAG: ArsI/CadI family heavy metal resistance metalloenzyme [Acidobacteriota bacterium]